MRYLVLVASVTTLLTACSSTTPGHPTSSSAPAITTEAASTPAAPLTTADPNVAICDEVHTLVSDKIQPTFQKWKPETNEFDKTVGNEMRDEATEMYSLGAKATGGAAEAIRAEAKGLTDLSIGIDEEDDTGIGAAADEANSALAALRGACNF